ncbi:MAG TPA: NADH-quinone oxidoreductase subunit L [Mycobacteriales bacterium]|jgi:NADH-quinone oxidoreductase subunit L|nr:NADH-quinone oxidoreductase subunit L [Mycobacteriales bacterium]
MTTVHALAYTPASGVFNALWLLLVLPAAGAVILLLGGRRTDRWGHLFATLMCGASFVVGLVMFIALQGKHGAGRQVHDHLYSWVPVAGFHIEAGLLLDPLSGVFVLLITGVGFLIHVYSIGYMEHDPDRRKFFAYLNLFIAAMLLLVLANTYLGLYVGWEGVGLASYLLIGFWQYKPAAATAAKKAFIANRVGDVGLSIAIMVMFAQFGRVDFQSVFNSADGASKGAMAAICLMLLLGACGKSGQFPLQTWLPDAMEGPTPVSALIHAATMVTAGVYLIARSAPLFDLSSAARTVVTIVGAVTLSYGAIVGCAYDDIKKVLAYSTVSQIGYMFLAVGLGPPGYAIAILHLLAHGFFKATMFLGAGSVMHAMDDEVDMRRYGGLWRVMPITFWTFASGYLAIIGFPLWSGFWTKDKIIEVAFDKGGTSGYILGITALVGAGVTAFYMTRLMAMTFFGDRRWAEGVHPHEAPSVMTIPMILLGIGSAIGGYLLIFGGGVQHWLRLSVGQSAEEGVHTVSPVVLTILSLLVVAGGVLGAYLRFIRIPVPSARPRAGALVRAARENLYADAFNEAVLMRPGQYLARLLVFFDNRGVDGAVNGLAAAIGGTSGRLRRIQTGFVRSYALTMLGGGVLLVGALMLVRAG